MRQLLRSDVRWECICVTKERCKLWITRTFLSRIDLLRIAFETKSLVNSSFLWKKSAVKNLEIGCEKHYKKTNALFMVDGIRNPQNIDVLKANIGAEIFATSLKRYAKKVMKNLQIKAQFRANKRPLIGDHLIDQFSSKTSPNQL